MKKLLVLLVALTLSMSLWAVNDVSLQWNATVHNGAAAGDPAGYIDPSGFLDTSGMATGSLLALDVVFENIDFTFAGYEFEFRYPPFLNLVSTDDADWAAQTDATYRPGAFMTGAIQGLPADSSGNLVSGNGTSLIPEEGRVRIGYLWTDTGDRPVGTSGSPLAGGVIGTMYFEYNNNGCDSNSESTEVTITAALTTEGDIFANDLAERVPVGSSNISADFGNPNSWLRTDANHDDLRNTADAVLAARGAFFGQSDGSLQGLVGGTFNWSDQTAARFVEVFDGNCDSLVNTADAVINARNAFNLLDRTQFKKLDYFQVEKSGVFAVNSEGRQAAAAKITFVYEDMTLGEPFIDETAKKNGWMLLSKKNHDTFAYLLINPMLENMEIPVVQFKFQTAGDNPSIAIAQTEHQAVNLKEFFQYVPLVEVYGIGAEKPVK